MPLPPILKLPGEILIHLIHHLDRPSALAFARTHSSFTSPCDEIIWRDLDLFLSPHHGEYPLVKPAGDEAAMDTWESKATREAEQRHRAAMKEKVKDILCQGNRRRFGLVRTVAIVPWYGATDGIVQILDMVSPNLQTLIIHPGFEDHFRSRTIPTKSHETLDFRMLNCDMTFPFLTTIRIQMHSLRFGGFIALLLNSAPNLLVLDVEVQHSLLASAWGSYPLPSFPRIMRPTKIKDLRIIFGDYDDKVNLNTYDPILDIFPNCPLLQRLSVHYDDYHSIADEVFLRLISAIKDCKDLRDLYCQGTEGSSLGVLIERDVVLTGKSGFASLRRYIDFAKTNIYSMFSDMPPFPALEIAYLDPKSYDFANHLTEHDYNRAYPEQSIIPSLAHRLRLSPQLRLLADYGCDPAIYSDRRSDLPTADLALFDRLDCLEATGECIVGRIRSFKHGGEELLHASLELDKVQGDGWDPLGDASQYDGDEGADGQFEGLGEPVWLDFTDFNGQIVPIGVIRRMMELEGMSEGDWVRGVEVGDEAWQVLLDWRDSVGAGST